MAERRNERKTEQVVRAHLLADAYPDLVVEEQSTTDRRLNSALSKASKVGPGVGRPEFIVHAPSAPDVVVLVECKALTSHHESEDHGKPADYAVDGVLHYAKFASSVRDVIAIGVSGQTVEEVRVSTYAHLRGAAAPVLLTDRGGPIDSLVPIERLLNALKYDPSKRAASRRDLLAFSRDLHNRMRKEAKLTEQEKPLVVSGSLIALLDDFFASGYRTLGPDDIGDQMLEAIKRELTRAALPHAKIEKIVQPYSFIANHEWLNAVLPDTSHTPLQNYCADLAEWVLPYIQTYEDEDVVGAFYAEFLRYTGGDKKGLGIVLTPRHITELFCELADLSLHDTVIDPCAGTGGFLISAMTKLDNLAAGDKGKETAIRERQLVGIEQQPMMFALAASNMLLRGDGKANLYHKSCFDPATQAKVIAGEVIQGKGHHRPTKGLVNPPYAQTGKDQHELAFVEAMLDMLEPGGLGIAIVPMSCGIQPSSYKRRLLERHTLVAAMSMPDTLFYPVAAVTCTMMFKAHQPHAHTDKPTWFGYWKDDGYRITRVQGRFDVDQRWEDIKQGWLDDFAVRTVEPGVSVLTKVTADDEWCAEAYMETDYSVVNQDVVAEAARRHALFVAMSRLGESEELVE